jgi:hypothetical protein
MKHFSARHRLASLLFVAAATGRGFGATTVWNANLNLNEFAGMPGGFESGFSLLQASGGGPASRAYDVLRQTGTDAGSGMALFGAGQDGTVDLTIRTQVFDGSGGRWAGLRAAKTPGGFTAGATIAQGASRPGDWGLVALEFQFAPGLAVTADQFALRLLSANGTSEAYEWTMVTLGGAGDAPFSMSLLGSYDPSDYSDLGSSTYYNAAGGISGQPGTGQRLGTGRSISQYLSGGSAAPVSGGLVQRGWYAVDDFNAWLFDGPEGDWDNPYAEDGTLDVNPFINGAALGLVPGERVSSFTVWIGVHDVGLDSNGDSFSSTDGNPFVTVADLRLGASSLLLVPEPACAGLLAGAFLIGAGRRKRN